MKPAKKLLMMGCMSLLFPGYFLLAQKPENISITLSQPGKSFDLKMDLWKGSIDIVSYNGTNLEIEALPMKVVEGPHGNQNQNQNQQQVTIDYKRDITIPTVPAIIEGTYIKVTESSNRIIIKPVVQGQQLSIKVLVPKQTGIFHINSMLHANISLTDLAGEIDITNNAGEIKLAGISGSAVVSNVAGNINANFKSVSTSLPMAFSTVAGYIDVSIPSSAKATVKAYSDNSDFTSEFPTDYISTPSPVVSQNSKGVNRIENVKNIIGKINGGGPELRFKTMEGPIHLRKSK